MFLFILSDDGEPHEQGLLQLPDGHPPMFLRARRSHPLRVTQPRAAIGATKLASTLVSLDGTMVITFYIGVVFNFIQVTVQGNLAG